jgi:long-chain fatty acid transport protein
VDEGEAYSSSAREVAEFEYRRARMGRLRRLGVAIALATLAAAPPAASSPADLFGFGPRTQALGGSGAALATGFEATYGNPALLSRTHTRQIALGWQAARFHLQADGPNGPGEVPADALAGTFIGAVLPLPFGGMLEDRITLGLGAFTPTSLIARARLLYPERAQFPVLADRAQTLSLQLGMGVDVGHGIRIGGGALALAELVGTVVVRTDSSGRVGTIVDDQLIATYAPIFGASFELDEWRAGATFRGALEGEFDVVVQVFDLGSLVVPNLHISGVAQYDPMQVELAVAREFGPLTANLGATYKRWSAFPGWRRPTVECPSSQPACEALDVEPVDFHDIVVPRVAASWELELAPQASATLRAGAFYEPSPAPEQTGTSNYWDNDRVALTIGYGVGMIEPLPPVRLDVFYQHHLLLPRSHVKAGGVDPQNPGYPEVETKGSVQVFGFAAEVSF